MRPLRSPLCRGPASLLAMGRLRAWCEAQGSGPAGLTGTTPPPWRAASPASVCCLVKPEVIPSQCPAQKAVVLSYFLGTQAPPHIRWVAVPQAERWAKKSATTKEHEPKLNLNICFLCNALQKAWHCLLSKSVPSSSGTTTTKAISV